MDEENDGHVCLKCSQTIVGLDNYIQHQKEFCSDEEPPVIMVDGDEEGMILPVADVTSEARDIHRHTDYKAMINLYRKLTIQGKTKYKCTQCDLCYENKSLILKHIRSHMFQCKPCKETFRDPKAFKEHNQSLLHQAIVDMVNNESVTNPSVDIRSQEGGYSGKNKYVKDNTSDSEDSSNFSDGQRQSTSGTAIQLGQFYDSTHPQLLEVTVAPNLKDGEVTMVIAPSGTNILNVDQGLNVIDNIILEGGTEQMVCTICPKTFKNRHELDLHLKTQKHIAAQLKSQGEASQYICDLCNSAFFTERQLMSHKRRHEPREYVCKPCGEQFTSRDKYNEHTETLTHKTILKSYGRECDQIKEVVTVGGRMRFECTFCEKSYQSKAALTQHIRIHTGERPFKCPLCSYSSTQRGDLKIHIKRHMGWKEHTCPACDFKCLKKASLQRHLLIHKERKRHFFCNVCGQGFFERSGLRHHEKIHNGDKPFKCDFQGCPYSFRVRSELKYHIRVHTGEKPYLCDLCGFSGKTKHALTKHKRGHFGVKPFKCDICDYTSSTSSHVKRHRRIHTQTKPYKCPYCKFRCNNAENLRKHILQTKRHEGKTVYVCSFCTSDKNRFGCNEVKQYEMHLREVHHISDFRNSNTPSIIAGVYEGEQTQSFYLGKEKSRIPNDSDAKYNSRLSSHSLVQLQQNDEIDNNVNIVTEEVEADMDERHENPSTTIELCVGDVNIHYIDETALTEATNSIQNMDDVTDAANTLTTFSTLRTDHSGGEMLTNQDVVNMVEIVETAEVMSNEELSQLYANGQLIICDAVVDGGNVIEL